MIKQSPISNLKTLSILLLSLSAAKAKARSVSTATWTKETVEMSFPAGDCTGIIVPSARVIELKNEISGHTSSNILVSLDVDVVNCSSIRLLKLVKVKAKTSKLIEKAIEKISPAERQLPVLVQLPPIRP